MCVCARLYVYVCVCVSACECVCVCVCIRVLVIRHANRSICTQQCVGMCGLSGCAIFFHITHKRHRLRNKVIEHKRVLIFSTTFV